jgi:hypothetical protein
MPMFRDSPYNDNPSFTPSSGCSGPCQPLTSQARTRDGTRLTCPYMYKNITTILPFFFYSRNKDAETAGYFKEVAYLGQGLYGAAIAGLAFVDRGNYPSKYYGALFMMDFSQKWIRILYSEDNNPDSYAYSQEFVQLLSSPPVDGARHTLGINKNTGNVCYLTMYPSHFLKY